VASDEWGRRVRVLFEIARCGISPFRIFCNRVSYHAARIGFQVSDFCIRVSDFYLRFSLIPLIGLRSNIQLFNFSLSSEYNKPIRGGIL
jgi:hypothetical protein